MCLNEPTSMQTHNSYGGERWTNKNLTTTESTLQNWIGKEKDNESKLGDHGVRKYEYETGRFISIDPLWSKYYGWTPYQYSMNSPIKYLDYGGEDIILFFAQSQGRAPGGHVAILVGQGDGPFKLVSKDGTRSWMRLFGEPKVSYKEFESLDNFYSSDFYNFLDYTSAFRIYSSSDEDTKAVEIAKEKADEYYNIFSNNCVHSSYLGIYNGLDNPEGNFNIMIPLQMYYQTTIDYKDRGEKVDLPNEKDPNDLPGKEKSKKNEDYPKKNDK